MEGSPSSLKPLLDGGNLPNKLIKGVACVQREPRNHLSMRENAYKFENVKYISNVKKFINYR